MVKILRPVAIGVASAALLTGTALTAHAATLSGVPVGSEVCVTKIAYSVRAEGHSSPYVARFTVKRNGYELVQLTASDFAAEYSGYASYQFCGKNKLGNPGPINLDLSLT